LRFSNLPQFYLVIDCGSLDLGSSNSLPSFACPTVLVNDHHNLDFLVDPGGNVHPENVVL